MGIMKAFLRLVLKTILAPVSLLLLLIKGILCLATKLAGLPIGLFIKAEREYMSMMMVTGT